MNIAKIRSIFTVFKNQIKIVEQETTSRELTDREWELIQAIRIYKKAYPNGAKRLLSYIREILDELIYG